MAAESSAPRRQPHPSPHRDRVGRWATWFALLGGPLAWSVQELVNVSLGGYGCYPHDVPLATPLWGNLGVVVAMVEAAATAVCAAAGAVAWLSWRRSREERPGDAHHVIESGDGRTRFLALAGMMTSALFLVAIGLTILNLVGIRPCGG